MGAAVAITRLDLTAGELRKTARKEKNSTVARRILALALVLEGSERKTAAESCGMDRQTLRDWVHRYNAEGLAGLRSRRPMGPRSRLTTEQQAELAALVEAGPDPEQHGVVRWRRVDLRDELERRFGVKLHERSVGKVLAKLGYRRLSVRPRLLSRFIGLRMKRLRRRSKKLCCDHHDNAPRSRPRQADRNLVPGRGADRPAGHADTRVGQAWLTASRAPRSTLRLGLSLRCRLSSTRRRRGSCHAYGKCRGDVTAFGGNQPQSRPRRTCRSRLRRRRLSRCRHRS